MPRRRLRQSKLLAYCSCSVLYIIWIAVYICVACIYTIMCFTLSTLPPSPPPLPLSLSPSPPSLSLSLPPFREDSSSGEESEPEDSAQPSSTSQPMAGTVSSTSQATPEGKPAPVVGVAKDSGSTIAVNTSIIPPAKETPSE